MNDHRISFRYATALFEFAEEKSQVEEVYNDILLITEVIEESRELRLMLKSPVIFADKKLRVLNDLFKSRVNKVTYTFIEILVKKRREENIYGILTSFLGIYRHSKNIKIVEVKSASPLDSLIREKLIKKLALQTNSSIILKESIDPSIIGGLVVKAEGVMFDDSIKKKVQVLKQEFNVNTYIKGF